MLKFMVLSAPRSASTWAANWLTSDRVLCLHDPVFEHRPEFLDAVPCDRLLGVACTALALLPAFVNTHPAKKVIVHRDLSQVNNSLESIGLTALGRRWVHALEKIEGMHVAYEDLFDPEAAQVIYEHLTGLPFDASRHSQLCAMHVEPHFEKIKIVPERAKGFRQRLEKALA